MKKVLLTFIIGMALAFCCAITVLAGGSGKVDGSTVTYTYTGIPADKAISFSVYLLTNDAHIKCYGKTSTKSPQARNGTSLNKCNITSSINKGAVSSKNALKVTTSGGNVLKTAERVTFSYSYVGGKLTATVIIENPSSALTGLAIVGKDGNYYYPVAEGDGTIDISALVKQAARNAAGPGGGSGSGGSSGGGSSGSNSGPGSGSGSGGSGGNGSAGGSTGGNSTGGTGSGGGSGSSGSGSGNTGTAGSGSGSESGNEDGQATVPDHSQDMQDIRDNISDITSPSKPSDHNGKGTSNNKPPCVLRRFWG